MGDCTPRTRPTPSPSPVIPRAGLRSAEAAAEGVIRRVQPTEKSDRRRRDIAEHLRKLIGLTLGCEVFQHGSVPLKTNLPDGDIDLTVLGSSYVDSTLIDNVRLILESEENNVNAKYEVKDIQYIHAEVRLIKCLIDNITVDISFNQIGGLCTVCFLELVDCHIGKNHLLKRSIILIKAWCYYESRILGAIHGLISTYALEILILYIFNIFHRSLSGPLQVLQRFLEYYSKFDWDNYGISLSGPVLLSSLPDLVVEAPNINDADLLFSKELWDISVKRFSVPALGSQNSYSRFPLKYLNIIDPLKANNNLGRSVSRASFYRIRSALSYGTQKLDQILMRPPEHVMSEVDFFFTNTVEIHRRESRGNPQVESARANGDALNPLPHFAAPSGRFLDELSNLKVSISPREEKDQVLDHHHQPPVTKRVSSSNGAIHNLMKEQILEQCSSNEASDGHSLSPLLDLDGDLESHLRSLRQVQHHLEYMFRGLIHSIQEASSTGALDVTLFVDQHPTCTVANRASTRLSPCSSTDASSSVRNLSPISCSSNEDIPKQSQEDYKRDVTHQVAKFFPLKENAPRVLLPSSSRVFAANTHSSQYARSDGSKKTYRAGNGRHHMEHQHWKIRAASKADGYPNTLEKNTQLQTQMVKAQHSQTVVNGGEKPPSSKSEQSIRHIVQDSSMTKSSFVDGELGAYLHFGTLGPVFLTTCPKGIPAGSEDPSKHLMAMTSSYNGSSEVKALTVKGSATSPLKRPPNGNQPSYESDFPPLDGRRHR